jgi:cobalt-zinc-cadmium efflux system protein
MSTTDIALTAHLVMPGGHPGDAFFEEVAEDLHAQFHITHPTIQIELDGLDHGCAHPTNAAPTATPP